MSDKMSRIDAAKHVFVIEYSDLVTQNTHFYQLCVRQSRLLVISETFSINYITAKFYSFNDCRHETKLYA